jgi:2,4-dienoyl-CoA reductase-like NADH-dependent reductase (Old Yellow Enzyme family)
MTPGRDDTASLFRPLKINGVTVKNRLAMGPIAAHSPVPGGRAGDQTAAFFAARAKGGIGLIIVGGSVSTTFGWEGHSPNPNVLRLDIDEYVPDLRRVTDAVHAYGTPIFAQINTGQGRMGKPGPLHVSASPINVVTPEENLPNGVVLPGGLVTPTPREVTLEECRLLEDATAESALRMQRAGFDGVELGAHMSYFLASFLSPRTNWRTDEYGGSVDNRARMVVNIIGKIRADAGATFPIGVRMSVDEHVAGGLGPDDSAALARIFERAGADYIAMTNGVYETMSLSMPLTDGAIITQGATQIFRKSVSIPLLIQGIHDPRNAVAALAGGHADMVMLARPMLADPEYANKVRDGRIDSIVQCIRCNACLRRLMFGMPIRCPVNSRMGRESRVPGQLPRLNRIIAAPIERVILGVTNSRTVMRAILKLAARRRQA